MVHGFKLTLEDLDSNVTFQGRGQTQFIERFGSPPAHAMTVAPLEEVGGSGETQINRLLLHTWDTSFISGSSEWNGNDYGLSFRAE